MPRGHASTRKAQRVNTVHGSPKKIMCLDCFNPNHLQNSYMCNTARLHLGMPLARHVVLLLMHPPSIEANAPRSHAIGPPTLLSGLRCGECPDAEVLDDIENTGGVLGTMKALRRVTPRIVQDAVPARVLLNV